MHCSHLCKHVVMGNMAWCKILMRKDIDKFLICYKISYVVLATAVLSI